MFDRRLGRRDFVKGVAVSGAALGLGAATLSSGGTAEAAGLVPTRVLGKTGERIPILVQGCGEPFDAVYSKILHQGLKDGVFYLDAAEQYGSHKSIGTFIEQIGDRKKHWITSKVYQGGSSAPEGYANRVEKFLPDLKTDYLDMFFMHAVQNPRLLDPEFIAMGDALKKRGLIRYFGFSCHDGTVVDLLNKAAGIGGDGINAIMFRFSFSRYGDADLNKAIDACVKVGIGLIAMKTQSSVPAEQESVVGFQSDKFTLGQAKLKAVWADERITAAVSHMNTVNILRENVDAAKTQAELSAKDLHQLYRLAALTAPYRCEGCNHICESRIEGDLRVADTLRYLMYSECYGREDEAKRLYRKLTDSERRLDGVDLTAAAGACPQGIDIRRRLEDARTRLA